MDKDWREILSRYLGCFSRLTMQALRISLIILILIPGILADGGRNSLLDPLAHLLLLLGGDPHLYEAVVGAGRGLEQVGQHVGAHPVVLDTQRLEARVLIHHGAQGLYGEITQLSTENIYMSVKIFVVWGIVNYLRYSHHNCRRTVLLLGRYFLWH